MSRYLSNKAMIVSTIGSALVTIGVVTLTTILLATLKNRTAKIILLIILSILLGLLGLVTVLNIIKIYKNPRIDSKTKGWMIPLQTALLGGQFSQYYYIDSL